MKTMCKRTLAFLLCALLLGGAVPFAASAAEVLSGNCGKDGDNVTWTYEESTGTLTVSGTGAMTDRTGGSWQWNEFYKDVLTIVMENGVTTIGDYAFCYCSALTQVTIPDTVTQIGKYAFYRCENLPDIAVPDSVTKIGSSAFQNVENVLYGGTATGSPWGAKVANGYREGVLLFDSVQRQTLIRCRRSAEGAVTIPEGVTTIGNQAFQDCRALTDITLLEGVTTIGEFAFQNCDALTSIVLPEGVTTIGYYAFSYNDALVSITLPDSLTTIGSNAFNSCKSLTNVVISAGVTSIGSDAFRDCPNLVLSVNESNPAFVSDTRGILYNKEMTELLLYPSGIEDTAFTVPSGVTGIGENAFQSCENLVSITLPDSVTSIGNNAFYNCTNLVSIKLSNNVASIGTYAFAYCKKLASFVLPDNVTSIGNYTFNGCSAMTSLTLGNGLSTIEASAFSDCIFLKQVTIGSGVTKIADGAFRNCVSLTKITVDAGNTAYCSDARGVLYNKDKTELQQYPAGSEYASFTIPDTVKQVRSYAFYGCQRLTQITIPDGMTEIGIASFADCASLSQITIPDSVTTIGSEAFALTALTDVYIPKNVDSIGVGAFACGKLPGILPVSTLSALVGSEELLLLVAMITPTLQRIRVDENNKDYSARDGVLYDKTGTRLLQYPDAKPDKSFAIPDGVTSIGPEAFCFSRRLTGVSVPDSVTEIGMYAFMFATGLERITIPGSVKVIYQLFVGCMSLSEVTIGSGTEILYFMAFEGCPNLKRISIPDSVTSIGTRAVFGDNLAYLHIPSSVTRIESDAFLGTTSSFYICSDTEDCYAKTYAQAYGIGFRVCGGDHEDVGIESGSCGDNVTWTLDTITGELTISGTGDMWDYDVTAATKLPWSDYIDELSYSFYNDWSFLRKPKVKTITIESGVTGIGKYAFALCGAESITIPETVTKIGENALACFRYSYEQYYYAILISLYTNKAADAASLSNSLRYSLLPYRCNLQNIFVSPQNKAYTSVDGVLYDKGKTTLIRYPGGNARTSFAIPDGVTAISGGEWASFAFADNLKQISIPKSLTDGNALVQLLYSETAMIMPVEKITVDPGHPTLSSDANGVVFSKDGSVLMRRPSGSPGTAYIVPDGVQRIEHGAFVANWDLESVSIPNSVTAIGDQSFSLCTSLTGVKFPDSVTAIGNQSFNLCSNLQYAHIPSSVTQIGKNVFSNCDNLAYICSDKEDCYAKQYAEENKIPFRVCGGVHPKTMPKVQADYEDGTFDEPVSLRAEPQDKVSDDWQKYEFDLSLRVGEEKMQSVYLIRMVDESGNTVQPNEGHTVTLRIPIPAGCSYEKCRVAHLLDENGKSESFKWNPTPGSKAKPFTISDDGLYMIIEVSSFSPFIVFASPSVKIQDTKKTLPYGEKRTLTLDVENLPDGAKIVWTAGNDRVELKPSADGKTCEVSAKKNGKVTIAATVVDADGKEIQQDGETVSVSVNLNAKANFFHKLWYWIFRIPWPFG